MSEFKEEQLSGWGNIPMVKGKVAFAHFPSDVLRLLGEGHFIPRGKGRSYADQATNDGDLVLKMEKMNRIIDFDEENGILEAQAGITLEEIINVFAPRGWFSMINPGTKYVTLGGAIANDIHGKAH
ncbi:MAG: FAD-dependent oxidoreductase, partial [Cyclobacteriaceae bacterium]